MATTTSSPRNRLTALIQGGLSVADSIRNTIYDQPLKLTLLLTYLLFFSKHYQNYTLRKLNGKILALKSMNGSEQTIYFSLQLQLLVVMLKCLRELLRLIQTINFAGYVILATLKVCRPFKM